MIEVWKSQDKTAQLIFEYDPNSRAVVLGDTAHYKLEKWQYSLFTRLHELYHVIDVMVTGKVPWYLKYLSIGFVLKILKKLGFIDSVWHSHPEEREADEFAEKWMSLRLTPEHLYKSNDDFLKWVCEKNGIEYKGEYVGQV